MKVAICGAAGKIGRNIVDDLASRHELLLIDSKPVSGYKSKLADLSQDRVEAYIPLLRPFGRAPWMELFRGMDVILHLAADSDVAASKESLIRNNIYATWNVIEAAAHCRVPRVVFASSNWAVKFTERQMAPDCYLPTGPKMGSEAQPRPLTAYGLSKAFGEMAGRMFVDEGRLVSFIALRLGYYSPKAPRAGSIGATRWIGAVDLRNLIRCSVEARVPGFHVVYGVSAQATAPYNIVDTRHLLNWTPEQRA